jgi:site-specific recombinase XerD
MASGTEKRPGTHAACFEPGNRLLELVGPGLKPTTAAVYRRDVADFVRWWRRPLAEADAADVALYLRDRSAGNPASADRRLAALAHFYRAGIAAGCWRVNPTVGLARARRGAWRTGRRT